MVAVLAVLLFPAGSVNFVPETEIDPDPVCVSAVGVKMTV